MVQGRGMGARREWATSKQLCEFPGLCRALLQGWEWEITQCL